MMLGLNCQVDGATNFFWHEALRLGKLDLHCFPPTIKIKNNIIRTIGLAEQVRLLLGVPMKVTSLYRPPLYNAYLGGASRSAHMTAEAIDFQPVGMSVGDATAMLLPRLADLGCRMESHDGNWIHLDLRAPGLGGRYFLP